MNVLFYGFRHVHLRDYYTKAVNHPDYRIVAALEEDHYYKANAQTIIRNRQWTTTQLRALGFTVTDSRANFVFAKSDRISGGDLYRKLKEHGILVRWFDSDRIRDYVRITIGSAEQMAALVDKIAQLL